MKKEMFRLTMNTLNYDCEEIIYKMIELDIFRAYLVIKKLHDNSNFFKDKMKEEDDVPKGFLYNYLNRILFTFYENYTVPQIELLLSGNFINSQLDVIVRGFSIHHLSLSEVKMYAKPEFSSEQMTVILNALKKAFTKEQVKLFANPSLTPQEMEIIKFNLSQGLSHKQIDTLLSYDYLYHWFVRSALQLGLSKEQIDTFVKADIFSSEQLEEIILGYFQGLSQEQVQVYAKPCFGYPQMEQIRLALVYGVPLKEVSKIADPKMNIHAMRDYRLDILAQKRRLLRKKMEEFIEDTDY